MRIVNERVFDYSRELKIVILSFVSAFADVITKGVETKERQPRESRKVDCPASSLDIRINRGACRA